MTRQLHLHILASGSKGNAAVIEGENYSILLDCGISRKQLLMRMQLQGLSVDALKYVCITHEHSDHIKGIPMLTKHHALRLFTTQQTAQAKASLQDQIIEYVKQNDCITLPDGITIQCFPTSHDCACPIGFVISTPTDRIGYCTDTGILTPQAYEQLYNVRILALEANHSSIMLQQGSYPYVLKQRIASNIGHLSNEQTAEILPALVGQQTEQVIAMHLSEDNNRPSVAVKTLAYAVGARTINSIGTRAEHPDSHLKITAAAQHRPESFL